MGLTTDWIYKIKVSEHEDRSIEITQSEEHRRKKD